MPAVNTSLIRNIPDFPKPGINFKDITPLLADSKNFGEIVDSFGDLIQNVKYVVGIEARGFIFASAIAKSKGIGFIPIRKSGKLPGPILSQKYQLEYASAVVEIHKDIYQNGASIAIVDDVLATGGTAVAAIQLCQEIGLKVQSIVFLMEIPGLGGRSQIRNHFPDLQIHILLEE